MSLRRKLLQISGFKDSVIFSVVYVLFINRFMLLGFNWLIKLPWQLCCPQTEQKSQHSLIFSSRAYALVSRGKRPSPLACLGFACSNFAKKNKRVLAVYRKLLSLLLFDTNLLISDKDIKKLCDNANRELCKVANWLAVNKL